MEQTRALQHRPCKSARNDRALARRERITLALLGVALLLAIVISMGVDRYGIPVGDVFSIIGSWITGQTDFLNNQAEVVIVLVRIPRILLCVLVGADAEAPNSISVENVVEWNPDVIITMTASSQKAIMEEKALQGVNAVKNGKVFIVPYGTYMWSVRSGEGAMMPLWLATIMYPDTFQDIDMQHVVKDFFREFYAYDIPEAEIKTVLAGNQK